MANHTNSLAQDISCYYNSVGSRLGYRLLLNNVRHFGYYEKGDRSWHFRKAQQKMEQKLGHTLALPKDSKVLDAGCGTGAVALFLARNFGLHVQGIDLLPSNINRAKRLASESGFIDLLDFQAGDYTTFSYGDGSFDGIYTMETLVHAANAKDTLEKFYKALKPGGRVVMHEYAHAPFSEMPHELAKYLKAINRSVGMPSMDVFEFGSLVKLAKEAGFEDVTAISVAENVKPMWKVFYLLSLAPYFIGKFLRIEKRMTNSLASVSIYRNQKYFDYLIVSATK